MKRLLFLLVILILPLVVHADASRSIMFIEQSPKSPQVIKTTPTDEHAKHCQALSRKVDQLKGKPQRRYVAAERYKHECLTPR